MPGIRVTAFPLIRSSRFFRFVGRVGWAGLLFCGLIGFGCTTEETTGDNGDVAPEDTYDVLYFESLVRGTNSSLSDTTEVVIREAEAWEAFQQQLSLIIPPRPVDFDQAMLIAVGVPVETGGYMLEVETVEQAPDSVIVTYVMLEPGGDCLNVDVQVTPFQVIQVRRVDQPVRFDRRREYVFCRPN